MVRPDLGTEEMRVQRNLGKSAHAEVILNTCIATWMEGWSKLYTMTVQYSYLMGSSGDGVE